MGQTTYRRLPFPDGTDFVKDGDNAIAALAGALDPAECGGTLIKTTAQTIPAGAWTALSWFAGANSPNVGGAGLSTVTGIRLPSAGIYILLGLVAWDATAGGLRQARFTLDALALSWENPSVIEAAPGNTMNFSTAARVTANQEVNLHVYTTGSSAQVLKARLAAYRIA